jgi:hypothetical protein
LHKEDEIMRMLRMDTQNWMHKLREKEGEIWAEFLCFFILYPQMTPLGPFYMEIRWLFGSEKGYRR